jgi:rhamnosyltransferase
MLKQNTRDHVCAIVITFNPDDKVIKNIKKILMQFDEVIIIDNSFILSNAQFLTVELFNTPGIILVHNKKNLGIAAALNAGVSIAFAKGYAWVATFDQDSEVVDGYLDLMFDAYEQCVDKQSISVICPRYFDKSRNSLYSYSDTYLVKGVAYSTEKKSLFKEVKFTMTSGNILNTKIFQEIGGCDEKLFIDCVDTELCLKYRSHSYRIIESVGAVLIHTPGDPSVYNFLGLQISCYNHSPVRRYYKYRNRILVYKKYLFFDPLWILQDMYSFILEICKIALLESQKQEKILKILTGIWHGLKGSSGEYVEHAPEKP